METIRPSVTKVVHEGLSIYLFAYQLAEFKAKGMVLMKLPNGYGSVVKLSGKEESLIRSERQQAGTTIRKRTDKFRI